MPTSTIAMASVFQEAIDHQMFADSTSGWMEENAGLVRYHGGKEIKIPRISLDGLGNYDREKGYPLGSVTCDFVTMEMIHDRGRKFRLDAADVDETNFIMSASNVISEFQRTQVIPEIDSYRYSRIYQLAERVGRTNVDGYEPNAATILERLSNDIVEIENQCGSNVELVITMPIPVALVLDSADNIKKKLNVGEFTKGEINLRVKKFNNIPIIRVPSSRMKTKYSFFDGSTQSGFASADDAVGINWIITPRTAPLAVSKTDDVKIITPECNQDADAWDIDYRVFHDLWITDSALEATKVNKSIG